MAKTTNTQSAQKKKKPTSRKQSSKTSGAKLTYEQKHALKLQQQKQRDAEKAAYGRSEPSNKDRFYCTNKELQAELEKWRDSSPIVEKRNISEELGKMLLQITNKMLNRSEFRNYPQSLKEDMRGLALLKIIKGLKNYDFEFNNPFAWMSMAVWNSYLAVIMKHYKQINIKKELMKKMLSELETYSGISPTSSLNRCIKQYLGDEALEMQDD